MELHRAVVLAGEEGKSLLSFLKNRYGSLGSVRSLKRAIEGKRCTVNKRVELFSTHPLSKGDSVELSWGSLGGVSEKKPLLLWREGDLSAYAKPSGVPSLSAHFSGQRLVHRLDKETSGIMLVAHSDQMRLSMIALFRSHQIEKEYLALVDGLVEQEGGSIISQIAPIHFYQGQTIYGSRRVGRRAITEWRMVGHGDRVSLIRASPITGRTHQLRVHFKEMGHPILGDYQYGKRFLFSSIPISRHLLHAYKISFIHPQTKKKVIAIAPIPEDFSLFLKELKLDLMVDREGYL